VLEGGKIYIYIYMCIYIYICVCVLYMCATHSGRFTWFATRFTVARYCARCDLFNYSLAYPLLTELYHDFNRRLWDISAMPAKARKFHIRYICSWIARRRRSRNASKRVNGCLPFERTGAKGCASVACGGQHGVCTTNEDTRRVIST